MKITKHFVTVGKRRVHYLRAGSGPAPAMLHASPCSAKVMRHLLPVFGERFTWFAFDTPGFGLSDKLAIPKPRIEDFADALAQTLVALGVEQVATYGRHTGASIAVEFAARHPQRCAMAFADGYAVFAKPYTHEQLERYLEPITPAWDGAHLLRLWFRYRDQHVFWPWNVQNAETRSDADVPNLDFLHRGVVELLEAGDDYRVGYAAPFRHRGLEVLRPKSAGLLRPPPGRQSLLLPYSLSEIGLDPNHAARTRSGGRRARNPRTPSGARRTAARTFLYSGSGSYHH
jgi:pimeloyl-ACP methyl ester carboxylesterase